VAEESVALIHKPFSMNELAQAVRIALAGKES
jgi:hypothetical protein